MLVADILASNGRQAISNHNVHSPVITSLHEWWYIYHTAVVEEAMIERGPQVADPGGEPTKIVANVITFEM